MTPPELSETQETCPTPGKAEESTATAAQVERSYDQLLTFLLEFAQRQADWEARQKHLTQAHETALERLQAQNAALREGWDQLSEQREQLERQRRHLDRLEARQGADDDANLPLASSDLVERLSRLEAEEATLRSRREELASLATKTRLQRDKIAAELRARRAELAQQQSTLQQHAFDAQSDTVAKLQAELEAAQADAQEKIDALKTAISLTHDERHQLQEQSDLYQAQVEQLRSTLEEAERATTELMEENRQLRQNAEQAASSPEGLSDAEQAELIDVKFELDRAKCELDDLYEENQSLKRQLAQGAASTERLLPAAAVEPSTSWEAAKRKLLAELEGYDVEEPEQRRELMAIEDVIARTDQVIAEKDEEIAELKHLLSQQSGSIGTMAVGAAAIADLLDQNELIQQERDALKAVQEEWREKLRQAEVEISMERAKLARERSEIEEKVEWVKERETAAIAPEGKDGQRGRWLERLGLRDSNGER